MDLNTTVIEELFLLFPKICVALFSECEIMYLIDRINDLITGDFYA